MKIYRMVVMNCMEFDILISTSHFFFPCSVFNVRKSSSLQIELADLNRFDRLNRIRYSKWLCPVFWKSYPLSDVIFRFPVFQFSFFTFSQPCPVPFEFLFTLQYHIISSVEDRIGWDSTGIQTPGFNILDNFTIQTNSILRIKSIFEFAELVYTILPYHTGTPIPLKRYPYL